MKRIDGEIEHAIIRHHQVDHWPIGTIAQQLGIHHGVVRRVLSAHGSSNKSSPPRARLVDPYLPFIAQTLEKYPNLHASRLYQMVRERGYEGSESHFRRLVAGLRPRRQPEPFMRLSALPAEEAQVDWGHFGKHQVGAATRPLVAFVMTLSWSRMTWVQYFHDMKMTNFQRGHVDAFEFFGGVPRKLLYDNLKSAVTERIGGAIRFNDDLLELASHYGFEPRAAAPRRGNEKGRVERTIGYIRTSFFAARQFTDIDDLNRQALQWSLDVSAHRRWPDDDKKRVYEQFEAERLKLRALPPTPFECWQRLPVKVGRTPWVRFDSNDYSVPARCVRREVLVLADHQRVRIVADGDLVADHARSYGRRDTVSNPEHLEQVVAIKRRGRQGSGLHRLTSAAPAAALMLQRAAERGHNLGSRVAQLLLVLDMHGPLALQFALDEVNDQDRVGLRGVQLVLEREARVHRRACPLPVTIHRQELRNITVQSADLRTYDKLMESDDEENS